jgi:hypothetical protein
VNELGPAFEDALGGMDGPSGRLPQRLSLDKNSLNAGFLLANTAFQSIDGRFELLNIQAPAKPDVHPT